MKMTTKQEEEQRRRRAVLSLFEMQALFLAMSGGGSGTTTTDPTVTDLTFYAPLTTTLVPTTALGSATPTFTRATTAYVADHEGILRKGIIGESRFQGARRVINNIASETWVGTGSVTLTTGQIGPTGASNATKVVYAAADSASRVIINAATANSIGVGVMSFWLRGEVGGEVLRHWDGQGTHTTLPALTTSWTRYSVAVTYAAVKSANVLLYANAGTPTIYATQAQSEDVTGQSNQAPGEYVSGGVTSAPYHGAGVDGVKYFSTTNGNSVASNVVTEATGTAISTSTLLGYLAEGARTNRLTYSNDLTNAAWVKTTMTTALTSTGPDGAANSATRVTASAGNALCLQTYVAAAASRTFSIWVKRITGSGNFQLTQDGAAFTTVTTTAGWTKVELNASQLNATVGFRIVTNADAFDVWCGQHEDGAFASSPIPTTTVAVTRNGDVLTYASASNWLVVPAHTLYGEIASYAQDSSGPFQTVVASQDKNYPGLYLHNGGAFGVQMMSSNTIGTGSAGATFTPNTNYKLAGYFDGTNVRLFVNGVAKTLTAVGTRPAEQTNFHVAAQGGGNRPWGTVRNVKIWSSALADATLVTLTT